MLDNLLVVKLRRVQLVLTRRAAVLNFVGQFLVTACSCTVRIISGVDVT